MKYLIQTFIKEYSDGSFDKFEVYSTASSLTAHKKVPEGTCRIVKYHSEAGSERLDVVDQDVDVQKLFDNNRPEPNTWYSDGQDRVSIYMLMDYLLKI